MNERSIAYCGLICDFCYPNGGCSCKSDNHCGKRLSPDGCYQYNCCTAKGLKGCWECPDSPCGKDMLAKDKIKMRAFVSCIKEDGIHNFISYLETIKEGLFIIEKAFSVITTWQRKKKFCNYSEVQSERNPAALSYCPISAIL